MKRALLLLLRGLTLRCPNCGGGGLFASWFRLKPVCPTCGLPLDREEGEDYFLGGMMFNIVLSELVYGASLVAWIMATWPNPPWDLLEYVGVPFMLVTPILFYPLSKTVWLAFDVMFRPVRPEELRSPGRRA
ncbi:MAG TPA: DUF983 domain-containing protein [Gemmatimonadaceae bacterium]